MRTTLEFVGFPERILQKVVELGIARSKTDALRMGIFSLNKEFGLIKNAEEEMVMRKLLEEETAMRKTGTKYISEKKALSKYR